MQVYIWLYLNVKSTNQNLITIFLLQCHPSIGKCYAQKDIWQEINKHMMQVTAQVKDFLI